MTNQQIFDKVVKHLLTQGEKSVVKSATNANICKYRGPEGLMCAIGALIPDEAYSPDWEGISVGGIITPLRRAAAIGPETKSTFLLDLQKIHDHAEVYQWSQELTNFAMMYGLSDAEVLLHV